MYYQGTQVTLFRQEKNDSRFKLRTTQSNEGWELNISKYKKCSQFSNFIKRFLKNNNNVVWGL